MLTLTTLTIAQSIHVINKHAKQVPDSSYLYKLKHDALAKLLKENKATKLYLHKFKRVYQLQSLLTIPNNFQQIFVIVECEGYLFHYPASSKDIKTLKFKKVIGTSKKRNPVANINYFVAKRNLMDYMGSRQHFGNFVR